MGGVGGGIGERGWCYKMLGIRQPEKKLNILIGNLNDVSVVARVASRGVAGTEEGGGRKKGVCLLTLRYYVLFFFFFFLYDFTTLLKCTTTTTRESGGGERRGKKNSANKQKVAKVHNGKIETEIMKIA